MKRITSFLLAVLMACTALLTVFPAAEETSTALGDPKKYAELSQIDYLKTVYGSPEAKLATMTLAMENDNYALYIQEYTGEVCVKNKLTGQLLFTNPYDMSSITKMAESKRKELLSQIKLTYKSNSGESNTLNSFEHAALQGRIAVKVIKGGIRVEYTIGTDNKKRIVPYQIEKDRFKEAILRSYYEGYAESINYTATDFDQYWAWKTSTDAVEKQNAVGVEDAMWEFGRFMAFYSLLDITDPTLTLLQKTNIQSNFPITDRYAIFVLEDGLGGTDLDWLELQLKTYTKYTLDDMLNDHDMVQYEAENDSPPIFKMALEYTLEDKGFQVRLPARGISFDASVYTLQTIQILPFIGAGRTATDPETATRDDEGYNFIPDGSGSIITFDQNKKETMVSGTMYGSDFGFYETSSSATANHQVWRVPVYGTVRDSQMKIYQEKKDENGEVVLDDKEKPVLEFVEERKTQEGYVAFITEGESLARIDALDGGRVHEYHSIGITLFPRQTDSYPLDGITVSGGTAVYTKEIERRYVGNYTIHFRLLSGDQANYVGMANAYREFLIDQEVLEKQDKDEESIQLFLDMIGDIDTTKTFLGMPVKAKAEITTFEDAKKIITELKEAGISNQVIRYLGWANGGLSAMAPTKVKVEKVLGGEKGLKELISFIQSEGMQMYLDLNFSYVNKTGLFDGFDLDKYTAKTIDGKAAYYQTYNPIVQAYNTQVAYVVSAGTIDDFYGKISQKYAALFGEGAKNISVGSLGSALNSSQDEELPLNREDAKNYTVSALEKIDADYDSVLLENGNYYTWKYVDTILNVPMGSSNRIATTAEVPFLAIVLHGYMTYTGEAINLAGDYEYTLLKTIETGACPYFVVGYENIKELKINGYSEYYAVEYATWKDAIVEEYEKLNGVLAPLQNQTIIDHEVMNNRVVKVTYDGGTEIYLNYNNYAVTVNDMVISAMDFAVVGA